MSVWRAHTCTGFCICPASFGTPCCRCTAHGFISVQDGQHPPYLSIKTCISSVSCFSTHHPVATDRLQTSPLAVPQPQDDAHPHVGFPNKSMSQAACIRRVLDHSASEIQSTPWSWLLQPRWTLPHSNCHLWVILSQCKCCPSHITLQSEYEWWQLIVSSCAVPSMGEQPQLHPFLPPLQDEPLHFHPS